MPHGCLTDASRDFLEGATNPPLERWLRCFGYLAVGDDHVVVSWLQLHPPSRVAETPLDSVPGDRVAGALRNDEAQSRRPGRSVTSYNHQTTRAVTLAGVEDLGELAWSPQRDVLRRRDVSGLFADAI